MPERQSLYCKLSKCKFAVRSLPFLGQIVGHDGIRPNPTKVAALVDWPTPNNPHELKCFLGLAQYMAKYIQGYAVMTTCLQALLKKHAVWEWSDCHSTAFQLVKDALVSSPVLVLPDPDLPYEVVTDACKQGLGAVLMQAGHPIAFTGRQLNKAEQNYTVQDMELLGVMYAVEQWRCYLHGATHPFTLVTDHHPNTYFSSKPVLGARQARWSQKLQDYDFTWQYRKGVSNIADPLSRRPYLLSAMQAVMTGMHFDWVQKPAWQYSGLSAAMILHPAFAQHVTKSKIDLACDLPVMFAAITRSQREGGGAPASAPATRPLQQQEGPRKRRKKTASQGMGLLDDNEGAAELLDPLSQVDQPAVYGPHEAETRSLLPELQESYLADPAYGDPHTVVTNHQRSRKVKAKHGLWYRHGLICIPDCPAIKRQILNELHDSKVAGHGGEMRTEKLVRRFFWWPSLTADCKLYVKGCDQCQRNKASTRAYPGLLMQNDIVTQKWQQVSMDFITHLPLTAAGHDSVLVVVCTLSKMVHFIACTEKMTGEQTAALYIREVWKLHGWPEVLITDRDTRFTSDFFRSMCKQLGIRQGLSSARHPETDGQTERMNRVLEETIRHYVTPEMDNWDVLLPTAEFAVNNSFSQTLGTTPFFMNYGYHPKVPMEVGLCPHSACDRLLSDRHALMKDVGKYFTFAQQRLQADRISALVHSARQVLVAARYRQKQYADQHRSHLAFVLHDKVMLKTKFLNLRDWPSKKLFPLWLGPFEVDKVVSAVAYRLVLPAFWKVHDVFHVSLLKPYRSNGQEHAPNPATYSVTPEELCSLLAIL